MNECHDIIIVGSGPAGLTAAIYGARGEYKLIVLEGKNPGGQLMKTSFVENWPGNISILGPQLINNIKKHAQHFGAQLIPETVIKVDFKKKPFTLWTDKENELKAHAVIIATGAGPKKLGCPGEEQYWGKGVTTCAVCDGALYRDMPVVIVGGGNTAAEDALFMSKFTDNITIVHISDKLTAASNLQKHILDNPKIKIIYNSTITEIKGNQNQVTDLVITDQKTDQKTAISARALFLAIGLKPNTNFLNGELKIDQYGYVKTFCPTTATSVEGVFACGDVADYLYRQAITSSGSGCNAAMDAQRYLEKR